MNAVVELFLVLALSGGGDETSRPAPDGLHPFDEPAADLEKRLASSSGEPSAKKRQQEDEQKDRPVIVRSALEQESAPWIDFGWLELNPRVGMAIFSDDYQIDPSPAFSIELRAPFPFLSPPSNEHGDYFGLFTEITLTMGERTIDPEVADPSGVILLFSLGIDFTLWRNSSWMMLLRGGGQYAMYGGITDLKDGWGPMAGLTLGFSLTRSVNLTLSPEVAFGRGGDNIAVGLFGLSVGF